jgi:hypothetical protein
LSKPASVVGEETMWMDRERQGVEYEAVPPLAGGCAQPSREQIVLNTTRSSPAFQLSNSRRMFDAYKEIRNQFCA